MHYLIAEFSQTPLWGRLLLVIVILFVGNFWLGYLAKGLLNRSSFVEGHSWQLLRNGIAAVLIAYIAVVYWIGTDKNNYPLTWGLYGRGVFVILSIYLTTFFSRQFNAK